MIISRYSEYTRKLESRDLPIDSSQLYDFMSGTPVEIAMPQLDEDDQRFVEGVSDNVVELDFPRFDELVELQEQFK